jgi:hypothetical protein
MARFAAGSNGSSSPGGMEFPVQSKPLQILHPRLRELQVEFARRVIDALGLARNPVLAMVEIKNESSPLDAWQRNRLATVLAGPYREHFEAEWRQYKDRQGKPALGEDSDEYLLFLAEQHRIYLNQMTAAVRESAGPWVAAIAGFVGSRNVAAGELSIELAGGSLDSGFAVVVATALDQRPLRQSGRILLSLPGAVMASQPGSDPPRPQRLTNYRGQHGWWTLEPEPGSGKPSGNRNGGVPPTWMRRLESFVTL